MCDKCDKCDEYLAVILDFEDDLTKSGRELERAQKYGRTLKEHLKKSSASTQEARRTIADLETRIDELEYTIRHLRHDPTTMTNAELRSARTYHMEAISALEARLRAYEEVNESNAAILLQNNRKLHKDNNKLRCILRHLQNGRRIGKSKITKRAANSDKGDNDGICVICLTEPAVYAHNTCGCLTYCSDCHVQARLGTTSESAWGVSTIRCPLCRRDNTAIIKVFNLPSHSSGRPSFEAIAEALDTPPI